MTSPKSIVSANSTTGADCVAAVRTALTAVYFIISALCLSIVQIAAGGVGGAQGLLILAVVDEQEGAGAAFLQQMDRRAARFDRAEQLRHSSGRAAECGQNAQIFAQRARLRAKRLRGLLPQTVQPFGAGLHRHKRREFAAHALHGKRRKPRLLQNIGQLCLRVRLLRAAQAQHGKLPAAREADLPAVRLYLRADERAGLLGLERIADAQRDLRLPDRRDRVLVQDLHADA